MRISKTTGAAIAGGIIIIVGIIVLAQPRKVKHTYEPVTDVAKVRECIKGITGKSKIDIKELSQNEQMLRDVNRFCLKTVENKEAVLLQLAQ